MENLMFSLNATMPVFLLMVLGMVFRRTGILRENMIDGLNNNAAPKKEKKRPKESVLAKLHQKEKEIARRSGKKAMQEIMGQDMERAKK